MSKHRRIHAALCLILILVGIAVARPARADGPAERDVWYSITDGEQRYGYLHTVVRRLDDGNVEYAVASRMMIEFLGTRQEFETSGRAVVSPDLTPARMEADAAQMTGRTNVRGHAAEGGFVIEKRPEGGSHGETLRLEDASSIVFNVALGDWLHRTLSKVDAPSKPHDAPVAHRVRVLDAKSGDLRDMTARLLERDAEGSRWSVETDEPWATMTVRLDGEGVMIEQIMAAPPVRVERASKEISERIDYRVTPDRELLMFPLDRELPPTRRLRRLDVSLTWTGIPPDEFELEDSRQKLKSIAAEGDRHTAIVSPTRPGDALPDITLPAPKDEFESTLAHDDFITPDDERIAALAREIVGEETSALAAAKAICRRVSEHIEPAMIAETLSGAQALERRSGKCTEYSTLFASLARAAGLPTRVALGQRRFAGANGEYWGGHMWNEVFVGEWIPVDASANEVGGSLDLLKFIHSDTVEGTQPLRWKLTESLEVAIADVELAASATALVTGLQAGTYTNAEYGFRFQLPDAAWTVEEQSAPGALVLRLRPPPLDAATLGDSMTLHVTAFNVPAGVPAKTIIDARIPHHRSGLDPFEILIDEATQTGGTSGHRLRFQGTPRGVEGGVPTRVTEVVLVDGETGALLNLIATHELHDAHLQTFEGILATFQFLDE